jgi:ketosteroid isomerase-like protein
MPIQEDDRLAITNQLGRFARILDTRDWSAVSDVFADNVAFDYGDGHEQSGIEAMRAQFSRFLNVCGPSQHLIGSVMIELDGNVATSRSYVQARHQGSGHKADRFLDTNGEYIDRWVREARGWRIVRRDARWAMHIGDYSVLIAEPNAIA